MSSTTRIIDRGFKKIATRNPGEKPSEQGNKEQTTDAKLSPGCYFEATSLITLTTTFSSTL